MINNNIRRMNVRGMDRPKKVYIETYGCQMNFSDSEIVASLMQDDGFELCHDSGQADVVFINTCSIREHAEQRVRRRLREFGAMKDNRPGMKIGVLGCMAERLKQQLLEEERSVDLIVGPDSYRMLPGLLREADSGRRAVDVLLSSGETYDDIQPVKIDSNGVTAFISIMRGCGNYCSYCVVPFTRGSERSRNPETILREAGRLFDRGFREVTLLGQNVNSYRWEADGRNTSFYQLLEQVAAIDPRLRVRFATSHPKDISDELLRTIGSIPNICKAIHLPVQSGSDRILKLMNRKYTREWYLGRVAAIREYIDDCAITTDIISGFCSETDEDHRATLSIMKEVGYDHAFMFKYSERPGTIAHKKLDDDVPEEVKAARLEEVIALQRQLSQESNRRDVGKTFGVLVEGHSKKSGDHLMGRNSQNKVLVFPKENYKKGDHVEVKVTDCTPATLIGSATLKH